jgi:ribonuclease P protein component
VTITQTHPQQVGLCVSGGHVIARELRLRDSRDFDRVRAGGRSWSSRAVVLVVLENDRGVNRYGFAVGKRVGGAVARNRAKRLLREVARSLHPSLNQGYDVLLIARNSFGGDMTLQELAGQVAGLVERARLRAPLGGEA